jgi:DNA-directed RNA polymerase subunit RPC12/RpoP
MAVPPFTRLAKNEKPRCFECSSKRWVKKLAPPNDTFLWPLYVCTRCKMYMRTIFPDWETHRMAIMSGIDPCRKGKGM